MENILVEKPKGQFKIWAIAGIAVSIVFLAFYVLLESKTYDMMMQMYGVGTAGTDMASDFLSINGLFCSAALVFFIGLFASKNRKIFMPFMLWTLLLTDLYFVMPKLSTLVQVFYSTTGMQMMYYLGLLLPPTLMAILLVSLILQKESENKKTTNVLAGISIIAGAFLFIFQIIYTVTNATGTDAITDMAGLWGAMAILVNICFSALIFFSTKKPSAKISVSENETGNEEDEEDEDEQLDEVVEKIAQQVCKGDDVTASGDDPDED